MKKKSHSKKIYLIYIIYKQDKYRYYIVFEIAKKKNTPSNTGY